MFANKCVAFVKVPILTLVVKSVIALEMQHFNCTMEILCYVDGLVKTMSSETIVVKPIASTATVLQLLLVTPFLKHVGFVTILGKRVA